MQLYNDNGAFPLKSFTFDIENLPRLCRSAQCLTAKVLSLSRNLTPGAPIPCRPLRNMAVSFTTVRRKPCVWYQCSFMPISLEQYSVTHPVSRQGLGLGSACTPLGLSVFGRTRRQHAPLSLSPSPKKATEKYHRRARINDRGW